MYSSRYKRGANNGCVSHQLIIARIYQSLPVYASLDFWRAVEHEDMYLEVIVLVLRIALAFGDKPSEDRLISIIIGRTAHRNLQWACATLSRILPRYVDDFQCLVYDLAAEVQEAMYVALIRGRDDFWETNFWRCLFFLRSHVVYTFMRKEGWWRGYTAVVGNRIPRKMMLYYHHVSLRGEDEPDILDEIEDERAYEMLLAVERSDLAQRVARLPVQIRPVVFLIYWYGHSEKETAFFLRISDRTVRSRLQRAYNLLRPVLVDGYT